MSDQVATFPLGYTIPKELILAMSRYCPLVYYKFLISSKVMFEMLAPFESALEAVWSSYGKDGTLWSQPLHVEMSDNIFCDIQLVRDKRRVAAVHSYNILADRQLHGRYEVLYQNEIHEAYHYKMNRRHGEFMIRINKNDLIIGNYMWNKLHGTLIYLYDNNELHYIYEYGKVTKQIKWQGDTLKYINYCTDGQINKTETFYPEGSVEKITKYGKQVTVEFYSPWGELERKEYYNP